MLGKKPQGIAFYMLSSSSLHLLVRHVTSCSPFVLRLMVQRSSIAEHHPLLTRNGVREEMLDLRKHLRFQHYSERKPAKYRPNRYQNESEKSSTMLMIAP